MTTADTDTFDRLAVTLSARLRAAYPDGGRPDWTTVERVLTALLDGAAVREEFGTRITWPDGKVEDRWCYRDQADAAAQVGWFAETIPHAVPGGSLYGATATLIRRLHLTLPAETVEEQR